MRAYYTPEQYTRAFKIKAVKQPSTATDGACCTSDYRPYASRLREGTAWVAHVLTELTARGPLDIRLFHAGRVILFLTPEALLA